MYRLTFDSRVADQWFVDTPTNHCGDEWAFWRLLEGITLEGDDLLPWRAKVKQPGQKLAFSFAGFDVPLVTAEIANRLAPVLGGQAQFPRLSIEGESSEHHILVATQTLRCVDEELSIFTKWGADDQRPDKHGEYRMFSRLRLDPAHVPPEATIFRVWGWKQALIVTDPVMRLLKSWVPTGLIYQEVD